MDRAKQRVEARDRIRKRIRRKVKGSAERPRLAIFRSEKHIYAQVIDDVAGTTLASASSLEKELRGKFAGANAAAAKAVGELVAERAKARGIEKVVFDRGGYVYHGNIKALADSAREKGLQF